MASIEPSPLKPTMTTTPNNLTQDSDVVAMDTLLKAHPATESSTTQAATNKSNEQANAINDMQQSKTNAAASDGLQNEDDEPMSSAGGSKDDPIDRDDSPPKDNTEQLKRPKGRSHGDKSNKHIRDLRTAATKGNIEAALKLGWSVERLTSLYNRHKATKGIATTEDEPIDDPELLARIEQRKEHGREATKRRTDKLKARAATGDIEAAKKLGLGKKTMEALFPNLTKDALVADNWGPRQTRELTPSEPQDFLRENRGFLEQSVADRVKAMVISGSRAPTTPNSRPEFNAHQANGGHRSAYMPGAFHGPPQDTEARGSWGNMRSWEQMYPMPPPQFQIETQLQTAHDEAKRLASIANQRVVDLGDKLKRYCEYQERFGVAMYEAMTKAADKLSVRDAYGSGRGMGQPIPVWTMMSDGGKMEMEE